MILQFLKDLFTPTLMTTSHSKIYIVINDWDGESTLISAHLTKQGAVRKLMDLVEVDSYTYQYVRYEELEIENSYSR